MKQLYKTQKNKVMHNTLMCGIPIQQTQVAEVLVLQHRQLGDKQSSKKLHETEDSSVQKCGHNISHKLSFLCQVMVTFN